MKKWLPLLLALSVCLTACGTPSAPQEEAPIGSTSSDVSTTTADVTTAIEDTTTAADTDPTVMKPTGAPSSSFSTGDNTTQKATSGKTTTAKTTKKTTKKTTTTAPISAEKQWYLSLVDSENAWVATCQLSNGAIAMTPTKSGSVKVNPYFADIAALSLLNQPDKYSVKVKRYMDWHFNHLNTASEDPHGVDGTIFDWWLTVRGGVVVLEEWLTAVPNYDSTDSYAATFLMVVHKYAEQTGDTAYVVENAAKIKRVVNALFSTMHNGLTTGKPGSDVKMLMDNCEVYGGLQAAEAMYREILLPAGETTSAEVNRLKNAASNVASHIESDMWAGDYYQTAITTGGAVCEKFSWAQYYPSATAQTYPIIYGLITPSSERAGKLYEQFCYKYHWENLKHPDDYVWASNAYTAAVMGDTARIKAFLTAYEKMVNASRGYPLYNADAAWACMTAYYMSQHTK